MQGAMLTLAWACRVRTICTIDFAWPRQAWSWRQRPHL